MLRETTLLRWYPTLGAEELGWGVQGTTLSCGGKEPGKKWGQGQPANKGPLALSWKKQQRGPSEGPNSPTPTKHHAYSEYREATLTFYPQGICFSSPERTQVVQEPLHKQAMQLYN